jgi:sterol desaturase/sphingolipid hydroxylase (fatty acid hydroxylase superfamily)
VNYWAGFAVDVVGIAVFLVQGIRTSDPWPLAPCLTAALGYGAWTLWEYHVHRFLFHEAWSPFVQAHLAHHAAPRGTIGLPFFAAVGIAGLLYASCRLVMPPSHAYFFTAGAYLGWLYYGILHHVEHATDLSLASYRRLRRHHLVHHAKMASNFGVSTTAWDRLFGTHLDRSSGSRRDVS